MLYLRENSSFQNLWDDIDLVGVSLMLILAK